MNWPKTNPTQKSNMNHLNYTAHPKGKPFNGGIILIEIDS